MTILEIGGLREITDALGADQYHVLHLSAHGSATGVELEDEDGNPVPVDAATFVAHLRAAGRPLPLIVLSSCAGGAGGSDALAAVLVRRGADRVVAMQTSVTDRYATRLAREVYETLAGDPGVSVAAALAEARRRTEEDRLAAQRAGGAPQRPEYGVVTLLAGDGDPPLRDPAVEQVPLARPTKAPSGAGVRELRIGDLIGRRRQLRSALTALRGGQTALDQFGAPVRGALDRGWRDRQDRPGRPDPDPACRRRLADRGPCWPLESPALTSAVADALAGDARLAEARARLIDPQVDDTTKLAVVGQLLRQVRLLLLFDDFEQNLAPGGRDYHDPGFAEMIGILLDTADIGRVLVTSRYPPPNGEAYLQRIDLPPLSRSELGRLLLRLPALRELQPTDRQVLLATIGGHPRLIEFVDALLRHGRANLKEVTSRLRRLAGDHGISVTGRRPFTQAVEEACCSAAATSSSMSCWPCSTRRSGSRMTLYREIAAGRLAAIRIRDRLLIPRTALERLVEDAIEAAESGSGGGSDAA